MTPLTASELATEIKRLADNINGFYVGGEYATVKEHLHAAIDSLHALSSQREEQGKDAATPGLLDLVSRIRFAVGDNGKRMQPELVEYLKEMRRDAARYRWLRSGFRAMNPRIDGETTWIPRSSVLGVLHGPTFEQAVDAVMATPKEGA